MARFFLLSDLGTQTSHPEANQHSGNLDLLRMLAVLCVLLSHVARVPGVYWLGSLGRFGVILFFVHTSYVLMESLERMAQKDSGFALVRRFLVRRAFRIYPLSIFIILVAVLLRVPPMGVGTRATFSAGQIVANLALVQNLTYAESIIAPLWSLPLEVQMYLLLPFIFIAVRRWRIGPPILWSVSLIAASTLPHLNDRLDVFRYAPCFAAGIVAFQWAPQRRPVLPAWCWLVVLLVALCLFGSIDNASLGSKMHRAWFVSLLVAIGFLFTQEVQSPFWRKLAHRMAEISYGIYLSHIVLMYLVLRFISGRVWQLPIFVISLLITASALHKAIERPGIALGRLLSRDRRQIGAVSACAGVDSSTEIMLGEDGPARAA